MNTFDAVLRGIKNFRYDEYKTYVKNNNGSISNPIETKKLFDFFRNEEIYDNLIVGVSGDAGNIVDSNNRVERVFDMGKYRNNATQTNNTQKPILTSSKYSYDGQDDFMLIPNHSSLNSMNSLTIVSWFKPFDGGIDTRKTLIMKAYTSHTAPFYQWFILTRHNRGANSHSINSQAADSNDIIRSSSLQIDLSILYNQWHCYVGVVEEDGTLKSYLNGVLLGENTDGVGSYSGSIANYNTPVEIGSYPNLAKNSTNCYGGLLNDIFVFDKYLTSTQIQDLFNLTKGKYGF